ncbi:MAG: MmcQ/YjbR family DNA-binding protein [Caulobacterales bacterium]|nr:MmcQ/YjbR family DNA-binding protein [Caulobacterales bacterium]
MTRDQMFACALEQPGAEDSTLHGGRCVRVRGHWIVNESREQDALVLALDLESLAFLMETEPGTYFQTPHYQGWPAVLVRYEAADDDRLREQIEKAWARRATKAQRKARGLA